MPLAFLRRAGILTETLDVSVEGFDDEKVRGAALVAVSVPMHTALRLGVLVARAVRSINRDCHICFYGLYAVLNAGYLLETVADSVIGGESEQALVELARAVIAGEQPDTAGATTRDRESGPVMARLDFLPPVREGLPSLDRYARLEIDGEERLAGYVEASRGCLHMCRHCPIPPVYDGRFFVVPRDIVLQDIRHLVDAGARHITFGDPDFLNGPGHSLQLVREMHQSFPGVTFDFTAKVEHVLKHAAVLPELRALGCVFAVSAFESLSDEVLRRLDKGHTRADIYRALEVAWEAGIPLRPSFVPFTPWDTLDDYIELLDFVESEGLTGCVDPVQFTIRLLVPPGSLLLDDPEIQQCLGALVPDAFTWEWRHPDQRMDRLHEVVTALVETAADGKSVAADTFFRILEAAYAARGEGPPPRHIPSAGLSPPRLTEAWFC